MQPSSTEKILKRLEDEAIVLRKFEFGDTSLILHVLTRGHGVVPLLAKGAQRAKNPLWGALDLPARLRIVWSPKPTREVHLLLHADLLDSYFGLRKDLGRFFLSLYTLELMEEAGMPSGSEELFELARRLLDALDSGKGDPLLLWIAFELRFLRATGLQPAFAECASCGARPAGGARFSFVPAAGGLVCASCRRPGQKAEPVAEGALRVAASLAATPWEQLPRVKVPAPTLRQIRRALDAFLPYHWERMPRTRPQMGPLLAAKP